VPCLTCFTAGEPFPVAPLCCCVEISSRFSPHYKGMMPPIFFSPILAVPPSHSCLQSPAPRPATFPCPPTFCQNFWDSDTVAALRMAVCFSSRSFYGDSSRKAFPPDESCLDALLRAPLSRSSHTLSRPTPRY